MKELYEIGVVIRGFITTQYTFRELPVQKGGEVEKDLRGAFISAINTFASNCFGNTSLEYLESGNVLFIFKIIDLKACDSGDNESVIFYGLAEKKKKSDKIVKKFMEKIQPMTELFMQRYTGKDFTEIDQFRSFNKEIKKFFD